MFHTTPGNSLDAASGSPDAPLHQLGASAPRRVDGLLSLNFRSDGITTRLDVRAQQPPLQVVRAFPNGNATLVHLQNVSGGVLGGDTLTTQIDVGACANAQVTTTGATRLYRSRDGAADSLQRTHATVGDGALLEWLPDPIIPFAGSRSRIETSIELGDDCGLFWWEVVAPGRVAHEELFAYDLLDVQFDIRATGVPIAMEHYRIEPAARSLASQVRMGPYRYLTTFYICRTGQAPTIWLALEEELRGIVMAHSRQHREFWGASTLSAHGIVVKGLSNSALRVNEALFAIWNAAKLRLYGTEAVAPRKVP